MNALQARVAAMWCDDSPLALAWPQWRQREPQRQMALAVADVLVSGGALAVEAGTGMGKTLAYLVPLLLSGQRALVCTATHDLQDQLVSRDIPALTRALGLPLRWTSLKGRAAYVCLHRAQQAAQRMPAPGEAAEYALLQAVWQWALHTRDGDLADFPAMDASHPLRARVTSTRENCLGSDCPRRLECHVDRARDRAEHGEWVVTNHHTFMADLALRDTNAGAVLPPVDVVVFDEAHSLNELGVAQLGRAVGARALRALARDLAEEGARWARGAQAWSLLALDLDKAAGRVATLGQRTRLREGRNPWPATSAADLQSWQPVWRSLIWALHAVQEALARSADAAPALSALWRRVQQHGANARALSPQVSALPLGQARWIEWRGDGDWQVVLSPTDSASLWSPVLQDPNTTVRSWVFTSATLDHRDDLRGFIEPLGLADWSGMRTLRLPSPLRHAQQMALHIPESLPEPGDEAHTPALAERVAAWAHRLGGRTLVLTTTLRAARRMAETLRAVTPEGSGLQVLEQGRAPRRVLLRRFQQAAETPVRPSVLVASAAFWQGIDLAGDALQLLVIDKLPFAPPDDPLVMARDALAQAQGRSAFEDVHLSAVRMALRQGIGRLIRGEQDRGLLVIGDRRLLTRSYGHSLLASLPAMRRLSSDAEVQDYLDDLVLTRASTTDCLPA